ncbi:glycosyltransferase family 4 protein [uncultured Bacteroides sp.]|uniref:MraY family glycosyltransferase n=1 Tax=uncultured Bacteroides sp. TaxID=162156 RepID=UPI0025F25868|nr:glycosyltransferase family 4 protein [uncultured Bacteroides sp.]
MYYIIVLVLLFVTELFYFRIADKCNIIDKPNQRSSHTQITLRGGGIIFYFGALAYFLANGFGYPWLMLALTLVTSISFVDDIRSTSQKLRLMFHFSAMALMFYQWGLFSLDWWWIVIALVVCTGIINAYNFMDGINGITGGYSLVVLTVLAYINSEVVSFVDENLIYTVICSVLVFCFFNFRNRAKCFAGDVGSVSIAFIILFLIGKLIIETKDFSWIILLAVYGVDSVLTIIHRLMLHENIGLPHRKHLYQLMANELKVPHVVVSAIYMVLQLIIAIGLLWLPINHWVYFFLVIVVLVIIYICFMKKYYPLHEAYLKQKR